MWQNMFDEYVKYYWAYPHHSGGVPHYRSWKDPAFGNRNPNYGVIEWRLPSHATVALIGDIGTGTDIAAAVLVAALSFRPDVILHVGDVYYSGTRFEFAHYFVGLLLSVFESQGIRPPVFTLPGNHEYFTGAVPYFECLDSNQLIVDASQQQAASYFSFVDRRRRLAILRNGYQLLRTLPGCQSRQTGCGFASFACQTR